ncbi:Sterol-sensing domain and Patched family-containing protein [Aphelenchoides bicaudatus]|nr:Sterol-sensing domain and Patched family-containing protein [Aphelenchoides bicaudatus]
MGIARVISLKRRSSVPLFGCKRTTPNISASTLKTDYFASNKPSTSSDSPSTSSASSNSPSTLTEHLSFNTTSSSSASLSTDCTGADSSQQLQLDKHPNLQINGQATKLQKFFDRGFRILGEFISDYPWWILLVFLLLTVVCSIKIPFTKQEDDLKSGYTPIGARSHQELSFLADFYNSASGGEPLIYGQDWKRLQAFKPVLSIINEPVRQFRNAMTLSVPLNLTSNLRQFDLNERFELNYPFMQMLGRRIDLSPSFFGVKKFSSLQSQLDAKSPTNIEFLRLIVLQFRAEKPANSTKDQIEAWEREVAGFINNEYQSPRLKTMALTVTLARDEVVRTGMTLFPFLTVGFVIMAAFSILSVRLSAHYYQQLTMFSGQPKKFGLLCGLVFVPLLATSTALGFMFWFGFRFGSILFVTPFLVMSIGVDDAYLMIHSWQRLSSAQEVNGCKRDDRLKWKISEMLADIGPSITITSLTNILAFTVGIFSPTPEIQLFCAGNAFSIFADYLYQLFVFVPVLFLLAKREDETKVVGELATKKKIEKRKKMQKKADAFMSEYCQWLCNSFTLFSVLLILCFYWFISFQGMLAIKPKITPRKLFLEDSIINDINHLRDDYILPGYTAISVFVRNAENMSNLAKLNRMHSLIEDFEREPQCLGANFTHFWLRDFEHASIEEEESTEFSQESSALVTSKFNRQQMSGFLSWPEYKHWNGFLRFNETTGDLNKFFAVVAFHGPELIEWESRGHLLNKWRQIADKYSDLGAFIWVDEAQFLDQIQTLIPSTIQSSIATLICMAFVCLIFMCNVFTLTVATLSIVSICIGVFGFLSLWGIDLDPISVATMIMSIGFSVDFPAHLTYHYYRLGKEMGGKLKPEERIYHALIAIGYPLAQCGLSTCLFVTCLLFIDTYMSEVFVKTMVLVVSLGVIHALIFIPTILSAFSRLKTSMVNVAIVSEYKRLNLQDKFLNKLIARIKAAKSGLQPIKITVVGNRDSVMSKF